MPAAVVSYGHSATTGYPASMTYPGGMVLNYGYDAAGRISSITANGENVVTNITYRPFGPVEDYTFGNALLTVDQTFNLRDQVDRIQAGAMDYQYSYHADGTVKKISGIPLPTALFTGATSFAYQAGTHKLDASTGAQTRNYTTDANGNIISDGTNTFIYDENNRLTRIKQGETTLAQYAYDAQNRRVKKITLAGTVYYHYDLAGHLICETDGSGNTLKDYIYLGNTPVAMKLYGSQAGLYYILTDHLGTPQRIVDTTGTVVWQAHYMPYGEVALITETITCNLRFPGQYYDAESGLHYNWNRYYDAETGRYLTADPIGLRGGINLYTYVGGNPINKIDPYGLLTFRWHGNWGGPGWAAGQDISESNLQYQDFQVPVTDERDRCYRYHDMCIWTAVKMNKKKQCPDPQKLSDAIENCDHQLADCLNKISPFDHCFWYRHVDESIDGSGLLPATVEAEVIFNGIAPVIH